VKAGNRYISYLADVINIGISQFCIHDNTFIQDVMREVHIMNKYTIQFKDGKKIVNLTPEQVINNCACAADDGVEFDLLREGMVVNEFGKDGFKYLLPEEFGLGSVASSPRVADDVVVRITGRVIDEGLDILVKAALIVASHVK
jgi:hypothetical protein